MARNGYRIFDSDTRGGPELPGDPTPTRSLSLTFLAMPISPPRRNMIDTAMWPSARS